MLNIFPFVLLQPTVIFLKKGFIYNRISFVNFNAFTNHLLEMYDLMLVYSFRYSITRSWRSAVMKTHFILFTLSYPFNHWNPIHHCLKQVTAISLLWAKDGNIIYSWKVKENVMFGLVFSNSVVL